MPRFYLEEFAEARNKNYYIYTYNKVESKVTLQNIRNVGQEKYFYDEDEEQAMEKALSRIEGFLSNSYRNILEKDSIAEWNRGEKEAMSSFVALQYLRTSRIRNIHKEISEKLLMIVEERGWKLDDDMDLSTSDSSSKEFHKPFIVKSLLMFSDIMLNNMTWKICINETETPFWTSDNPCALYNELEPENPYVGNMGFMCKGFQLHFPLSPRKLLILMNPDLTLKDLQFSKSINDEELRTWLASIGEEFDYNIIGLLPDTELVIKERVMFENNLQVVCSSQFIYSVDKDFWLADQYLQEYPIYRDRNRKHTG